MPIFDLKCTQCGLIARDVFFIMKMEGFTCRCGAINKFKKLPSKVEVHFKGSGLSK